MTPEARIQLLEDQIIRLEAMIRNLFRVATAQSYDPETDEVVAVDDVEGDDENGKPETPSIRVIGQSGAVQKRTTISPGEMLLIISPGGDFGIGSFAIPLGDNERNPSPSSHGKEDVTVIGQSVSRLREDRGELLSEHVDLGSPGGPPVARKGDKVLITTGSSAGLWPIVTAASKTYAV
ncbi:MAG: hypothetical protein JKY49_07545 [Cohaesibacteraceae bacterium]|nr:hypothetical protein [Cohaesibacteraceae bacterium]MBL4876700.1 hypothetical protein [Cohaesibacteraceae bacterium]